MVEAWIKFANGGALWQRFGQKQRWMVFGEKGAMLKTRDEDVGEAMSFGRRCIDMA